jgi:aldehyde:ferredoxin oxidoreductase
MLKDYYNLREWDENGVPDETAEDRLQGLD